LAEAVVLNGAAGMVASGVIVVTDGPVVAVRRSRIDTAIERPS
jgi:hypothetical protein